MEYEVKEQIKIEDGSHKGVITEVMEKLVEKEGKEPFNYIDVYIELEGSGGLKLKAGYPAYISKGSSCGELLMRFGEALVTGHKYNIDEIRGILVGKRTTFLTMKKKSSDGKEYARIIEASVKPIN